MNKRLDSKGREILDPRPMTIPVGFHHPPSLESMMAKYVRDYVSKVAQEQGFESIEEADDFDVDDDPELKSKYELDRGQEEAPRVAPRKKKESPKPATIGSMTVDELRSALTEKSSKIDSDQKKD